MNDKKHFIILIVIIFLGALTLNLINDSNNNDEVKSSEGTVDIDPYNNESNNSNNNSNSNNSNNNNQNNDEENNNENNNEEETDDEESVDGEINNSYIPDGYFAFYIKVSNAQIYKIYDYTDVYVNVDKYNEMLVTNTQIVSIRDKDRNRYDVSDENTVEVAVAVPRETYYLLLKAKYITNSKLTVYKINTNGKLSSTTNNELLDYINTNTKMQSIN